LPRKRCPLLYSLAPVPVSAPGNSLSYGIEANLGLSCRNPGDGLFGGATDGVLWPMGALDRGLITPGGSSTGSFTRTEDASTAQVLRAFVGIRFQAPVPPRRPPWVDRCLPGAGRGEHARTRASDLPRLVGGPRRQ
jgi:hypothetical protein